MWSKYNNLPTIAHQMSIVSTPPQNLKFFWTSDLITLNHPHPLPKIGTSHGELQHCRDFALYQKVTVSFTLFIWTS